MYVREQLIEPEQIPTTPSPIARTVLEIILQPNGEYFHCMEHNMLYKDPLYETPLVDMTTLQRDLKLAKQSQVIPFLKSQGFTIRSGLCDDCQQETLEWVAQA